MKSKKENQIRIAIQNPIFIFQNQKRNFNGYNYLFFQEYVSVIYVTDYKRYFKYKLKLKELYKKRLIKNNIKIILNPFKLKKESEILINFSGRIDKFLKGLPRIYEGLKVCHLMDYNFNPSKMNKKLEKSKVDYILGYCDHYKNSSFFRKYYPKFQNRIISVPFGYGERFEMKLSFDKRINKAIALGSVNPLNDINNSSLREYEEYFLGERFTHKLRRKIVENREIWNEWIDDLLPTFPETKNPNYLPEDILNNYKMFINDSGLLNFPPARTYEGIASGCVMIAENLEIYKELGFKDGYNCILFKKGNYDEMVKKIKFYMENPQILNEIQKNSLKLSKNFNHKKIAEQLYTNLIKIYLEKKLNNFKT